MRQAFEFVSDSLACTHIEQIVSRSSASVGVSLLAPPVRLVLKSQGTPLFLQIFSQNYWKGALSRLVYLHDHLTFRQACASACDVNERTRVCAWPLVSTASVCPGDDYDACSTSLGLRPMQHVAVMGIHPIRPRFNVMGHAYSAPAPWQAFSSFLTFLNPSIS
jgi:hypothetical protein